MALDDFFASGRVHTNQAGQIVVPPGAEIVMNGGAIITSDVANNLFPQKITPLVLRWPFPAASTSFLTFCQFNMYIMDVWFIKIGDGGAGDEISIRTPKNQAGDQLFSPIPIDVNFPTGSIVRPTNLLNFPSIGLSSADLPQELRFASVNVTNCACDLYLMVGPFPEGPSPRAI